MSLDMLTKWRFTMQQRFLLVFLLIAALAFLVGCKEKPTDPVVRTVATPVFSPAGGSYSTAQTVTITCATEGATIRYTTDGSTPTASSAEYSAPLSISATTTLKTHAYKAGWNNSQIATAVFTIQAPEQVATPAFSPSGGTYSSAQTVSITCATPGATIRYTTDGTVPTATSSAYSNPLTVSVTTTINAKGFKSGWTDSATATADYLIADLSRFVLVPGGTFTMGDTRGVGQPGELPTHSVTLNSFYIGKYEVTQAEYSAVMGFNPAVSFGVGDNYPVQTVSHYSILKYCNLRSMNEGLTPCYTISGSTNPANWGAVPIDYNTDWELAFCNWSANGYRLPTEAEWEYAARGASTTPDFLFSGSESINDVAWYLDNWGQANYSSHTVGALAPNGIGAYDMSGNVWEWCWDWIGEYSPEAQDNPSGPASGSHRLVRGGSWSDSGNYCRVSYRDYISPYGTNYTVGFRVCRSLR